MLRLCLKHITWSAAFVFACSHAFFMAQGNARSLDAGSLEQPRSGLFEHAMEDSRTLILLTPERLLIDFINSERRVREALNQHTFRRDVLIQTIGPDGEVTGQYVRNSQFVFDDKGNRIERVLFHPRSTLQGVRITKEDIQDLAGAQLLGVDVNEASKYQLTLAGKEMIDGYSVYAVDVGPRYPPDPYRMRERYLVGRIWLDAGTLQVVKIRGIVQPQGKQRFPLFETSRQWVAGSLLFPDSTTADDILRFPGRNVRYRIKVRYYEYKLFRSTVDITELNESALN